MGNITPANQNDVATPIGNNLVIFVESITDIMKVKDVNGNIQPLSDFITSIPSASSIIETDGVFLNKKIGEATELLIPLQGATGIVSVPLVNINGYGISNGSFSNPSEVSFIKLNDIVSDYIQITLSLSSGFTVHCENLTYVVGGININTKLTSLNLPILTYVRELTLQNNLLLSSINIPLLKTLEELTISDSGLSTINLPSLTTADTVNLTVNSLLTIDLPLLTIVDIFMSITRNDALTSLNLNALTSVTNDFDLNENVLLTSIALPSLVSVGNLNINYNTLLTSITLPSLTTVTNSLNIQDNPSLTSIYLPLLTTVVNEVNFDINSLVSLDLPLLSTILDLNCADNPSLTSVTLPSLTSINVLYAQGCALTETSVDYILALLVSIPTFTGVDCNVTLDGGTNSPPSATGLLDVSTLEGRGCTVIVNT